jgi:CheY-like chemotaxis protein
MNTILVVDDEEAIRRLVKDTLELAGYTVLEGRSGKEAVEMYRANPTDLVLMDILMPGQDGFEVIKYLCKEFPSAKIIAMTGGTDTLGIGSILELAKLLGARRTLSKPFNLTTLLDTVREELQEV